MTDLPSGLGVLLPSRDQCQRGSQIRHAFKLPTSDPELWSGRRGERLPPRSLCGAEGWREGSGEVTCKRCLRTLETLRSTSSVG